MKTVTQVMSALKKKGSAQTRKTCARHGAPDNMFGVKIADLKVIAKQIKGKFKKWEITTEFKELSDNLTNVSMTVDYEMPLGPLGNILDKVKFAKSAENGLETALFKVRGLLEGNGSIPVYITLDAYQKLLAEKKKMNNVPVSTALTAILEKYSEIEAKAQN